MLKSFQLTVPHLIRRARSYFAGARIVSHDAARNRSEQTFAEFISRVERYGGALENEGLVPGDRIATLAANHAEHMEVLVGATAFGYVVHTLNPKFDPKQLAHAVASSDDRVYFVDHALRPILEQALADRASSAKIIEFDSPKPESATDFRTWRKQPAVRVALPELDEETIAAVCHTSGSTGAPKGVTDTHREILLQSLVLCSVDGFGVSERSVVLPVVPLYHAMAWVLPFAALLCGATLVYPGSDVRPEALLDLIESERVTIAAGATPLWARMLKSLDAEPDRWNVRGVQSFIGGSAASPDLLEAFLARHGMNVVHAWGMTEVKLGAVAHVTPQIDAGSDDARRARFSQGRAVPLMEHRITTPDGEAVAWGPDAFGELEARGVCVCQGYEHGVAPERFTSDGWFKTGDLARIDAHGYVELKGRAKDVIKSGGEWISSVAVEHALCEHPAIIAACVFGVPNDQWGERPVAAIVLSNRAPGNMTAEALTAHLKSRITKYWIPDAFIVLAELPLGATNKPDKTLLQARWRSGSLESQRLG